MDPKLERRGLGRGLSALMADIGMSEKPGTVPVPARDQRTLPIEVVLPNPNQPRRDFDKSALDDLAASIAQKGIIQPLIVRPLPDGIRFEIIAGERRWRAAQLTRLHEVPVIIREMTDAEVIEVAIIENIQRADLNPIEEAAGYRQLMDRFGHTQEKIAEALSKSRSHIANLLRLLQLPDDVQSMVRHGTLSAGHARALVTHPNALELAKQVVGRGLSVRATEELARQVAGVSNRRTRADKHPEKDADTLALEADLAANLKMAVSIMHEAGTNKGRLTITYNTLDDLDLLCRALSMLPRDGNF